MIFSLRKTEKSTDAQLLEKYLATGRVDVLGDLYDRYIPLVYGLCLKYLGSTAAAEDGVMQIFEELTEKVRRYEIREFRTWLYSVARNYCLQQIRSGREEPAADFPPAVMESGGADHLLFGEEDEARMAALRACMEKLPAPQRESIRMFFMESMSYADISQASGYSLKSVKSYIQNGKRNLRICMEENGYRQ